MTSGLHPRWIRVCVGAACCQWWYLDLAQRLRKVGKRGVKGSNSFRHLLGNFKAGTADQFDAPVEFMAAAELNPQKSDLRFK